MLGPLKSYSSIDRYFPWRRSKGFADYYDFLFSRFGERNGLLLQDLQASAKVFSNIQGGSRFEESLTQPVRKEKLQKILVYFSNDFVNAILNTFGLFPPIACWFSVKVLRLFWP